MIITIPGEPMPKQSDKSLVRRTTTGRAYVHHYQSKEIKNKESAIKLIAARQLPKGFKIYESGVIVTALEYYFYPPKYLFDRVKAGAEVYKTTKPDLTDNLNKLLFDALQGVVYVNDSQICQMNFVSKRYSLEPRTVVGFRGFGE